MFGKAKDIEAKNAEYRRLFSEARAKWEGAYQNSFKAQEQEACSEFDRRLVEDVAFMHQVLEDNLQDISWPRETLISFEIADTAASAKIDVDLPEIEDMPRRVAKLPDSGYKLNIKELSARAVAELYSRHVHMSDFAYLEKRSPRYQQSKSYALGFKRSTSRPARWRHILS